MQVSVSRLLREDEGGWERGGSVGGGKGRGSPVEDDGGDGRRKGKELWKYEAEVP